MKINKIVDIFHQNVNILLHTKKSSEIRKSDTIEHKKPNQQKNKKVDQKQNKKNSNKRI